MRIIPLASGSLGNATLVETARTRLLIDAGLPIDELERRLQSVGAPPKSIDALFVTHRHHDHIRAATAMAARHRTRIWATPRTARALGSEAHRRIRRIAPLASFVQDDLELCAIPLSHDAPETCALRVDDGHCRYGHATDLGVFDELLIERLGLCEALLLEFNHDRALLAAGNDPPELKARILAPTGHLANDDAAALLARLVQPRLRCVWLAHLSRRNNRPALALAAARGAWPGDAPGSAAVRIEVAEQDRTSAEFLSS